ncbi:sugar transferase [Spirosoma knui]
MLSLDSHYKTLYVYAEPRTRQSEFTYQHAGKRVFDICFSLLVIVLVLSWLIPLLGILIKLDSAGPVFFAQIRTGYRRNLFYCLKFRTMSHDPNAPFKQATKQDIRVTRLGRFLRKTNLDEMPQFLNVLIGNMSIVGPRPHPIQLDDQYWNTLPKYRSRYRTKPGITGLAQVRGCRGETDKVIKMAHRLKYDRLYNRKQSLGLDLKICYWTVLKMVTGDKTAW